MNGRRNLWSQETVQGPHSIPFHRLCLAYNAAESLALCYLQAPCTTRNSPGRADNALFRCIRCTTNEYAHGTLGAQDHLDQ